MDDFFITKHSWPRTPVCKRREHVHKSKINVCHVFQDFMYFEKKDEDSSDDECDDDGGGDNSGNNGGNNGGSDGCGESCNCAGDGDNVCDCGGCDCDFMSSLCDCSGCDE